MDLPGAKGIAFLGGVRMFLMLGWRPEAISKEIFILYNTCTYDTLLGERLAPSPSKPGFRRPSKLTRANEDVLSSSYHTDRWLDEIDFWLVAERSVVVSRSKVCRLFERNK